VDHSLILGLSVGEAVRLASRGTLSEPEAVCLLERACSFGLGPQPTQNELLEIVEGVERQYPRAESAELQCCLGGAWKYFSALFVRGPDRKPYLQRSLRHYERAYELEALRTRAGVNRYAATLGNILVNHPLVRDLERGIMLLESAFLATATYEPVFCSYAEALYKAGEYQKTADVATELHRRACASEEWKGSVPPAPMNIAGKAYRAIVRGLRKEGRLEEAMRISERLLGTGAATKNDETVHERLAREVRRIEI